MKKVNSHSKIKVSIDAKIAAILIALVAVFFIFTADSGGRSALRWIIACFGLAFLLRPCLQVKYMPLWDNGFGISFGLSLALSFFLAWFISALHIAPFNTIICYLAVFLIVAGEIAYGSIKKGKCYRWNRRDFERFLCGFAVFAMFFAFAFWVIGFNPLLDSGTENYMDLGFMEAIYGQQEVAPWDIWFSGERLNYYYLGQAAAVYLTRLAFTTPEYGYNLMLCTFWSMVFVAAGEIAGAVTGGIVAHDCNDAKCSRIVTGISVVIASIYSALAANGHWLVYGVFKPLIDRIKGLPVSDYWFPNPTTFIAVDLGDLDNGKNEFPSYSAILGDLHAHVINVIFVLPLIALLLDYAFSDDDKKSYGNLLLCGILLGLFKGSNYWDFAIYFVITGAVVVFSDIKRSGFNYKTLIGIAIKAVSITVISIVTILPFTLNFVKMTSGIFFTKVHSPINKMIILWGFPFVISIGIICWLYYGKGKQLKYPSASKEGLLALILCTMGLVMTPEVVYMQDIYGNENARFNTMFKMTYQAFHIFGIIIGIAVGFAVYQSFWNKNKAKKKNAAGVVKSWYAFVAASAMSIVVLLLAAYTPSAIKDWMGNVFNGDYRKGISTLEQLTEDGEYCYEMYALDVLKDDKAKVVNIVEAAGDSYTRSCALSVMSGACTPAGWFVHEWMWRDNSDAIMERSTDVRWFYESGDTEYCREFIEKYDIDYVYVGTTEMNNYDVDYSGFWEYVNPIWTADYNGNDLGLFEVNIF